MKVTVHTDVSGRPVLIVVRGDGEEDLSGIPRASEIGIPVLCLTADVELEFD